MKGRVAAADGPALLTSVNVSAQTYESRQKHAKESKE